MFKTALTGSLLACVSAITAQENWTKYTGNPILRRDTVVADFPNDIYAISDCFVLKDGGLYKMWYTCGGFHFPDDGYHLKARICYCESENGIDWDKSEANPVVDIQYGDAMEWENEAIETASILIDEDAIPSQRYQMWYSGLQYADGIYEIGHAVSEDGIHWVKYSEPVLRVSTPDNWDNGFLEGPSVIKHETGYHMWYAAFDAVFNGQATDGKVCIGYASSEDGIHWDKYTDNPVLMPDADAWDAVYVQDPHVLYFNDQYHMWYGGVDHYDFYGQEVGYAYSDDGIHWTKSAANPVMVLGDAGSWDANTSSFPSVLLDDNQLKMWYTGKSVDPLPEESLDYYWEIGYATGDEVVLGIDGNLEGMHWEVYPNPFQNEIIIDANFQFAQIELFSLLGTSVYRTKFSPEEKKLPTSFLPSGTYLLVITTDDQCTWKWIIKSN